MKEYQFMMPEEPTFEEKMEEFQTLLDNAKHVVFFGGAGVSTESGVPDFRSKDGLYNQKDVQFEKYEPEYLLSKNCLYNNPTVFYEFYRQKMDCRNVEPNVTHLFLAELEASGKKVSVVTQNIDGLHQKAGSKRVYEVHGTTMSNYCTYCNKEYPADYLFHNTEKVPKCSYCNRGMVRPAVTLYGETLPRAYSRAEYVFDEADLVIVAGTSLSVYPAAGLVRYCECPVVVVNREETNADKQARLVFHNNLGDVFRKLKVRK